MSTQGSLFITGLPRYQACLPGYGRVGGCNLPLLVRPTQFHYKEGGSKDVLSDMNHLIWAVGRTPATAGLELGAQCPLTHDHHNHGR